MEGSHQVNWNSIVYRKGAVQWTEIEWPFLAAKGFNTNLVHFLPPYHVIFSNVHLSSLCAWFPTGMDVHLKQHCVHKILCTKNYNLWRLEFELWSTDIKVEDQKHWWKVPARIKLLPVDSRPVINWSEVQRNWCKVSVGSSCYQQIAGWWSNCYRVR